jgi:hypothetical protein
LLGTYDYTICKKKPYNWVIATSTKQLSKPKQLTGAL